MLRSQAARASLEESLTVFIPKTNNLTIIPTMGLISEPSVAPNQLAAMPLPMPPMEPLCTCPATEALERVHAQKRRKLSNVGMTMTDVLLKLPAADLDCDDCIFPSLCSIDEEPKASTKLTAMGMLKTAASKKRPLGSNSSSHTCTHQRGLVRSRTIRCSNDTASALCALHGNSANCASPLKSSSAS